MLNPHAYVSSIFDSVQCRRALIIVIILLLGAIAFHYYRLQLAAIDEEIKNKVAKIKNHYGVDVNYQYDRQTFFPSEYLHPTLKAAGAQLSLKLVRRSLPLIVDSFLSKYPKDVVRNNLAALYLLGKLEFKSKGYGGTYFGSSIYINGSDSPDFLLRTLHAEFSSILFHKYDFPKQEWVAINGLSYLSSDGESGYRMIDDPSRFSQTEDLLRHGFLTHFSRTDLENDFNTFAAWTFTKPQELAELVSKHERIRRKKDLVLRFYKSIDPTIDIPAGRISTSRKDTESMVGTIDLIAALIGYPVLVIAGTILHLKLRRAPTLIFAVGCWGSLLAFALKIFGDITTGVLSPLSFLVRAVGLLWLAIDLKKNRLSELQT